jgi:hypothetical protein
MFGSKRVLNASQNTILTFLDEVSTPLAADMVPRCSQNLSAVFEFESQNWESADRYSAISGAYEP